MRPDAFVRAVFVTFLVASAAAAHGQYALEVLSLRHRTAEQVLPALRPLVESGGTLTGQGNQLLVRTSPGNLAELRRALEAIDQPARRLQISVRFDDSFDASRRSLGASGRIGADGSRVEIRARQSDSSGAERVDQRVQVLEGSRAMIYTGQSQPVRERRYIQTPGGVVSQEVTVLQDTRMGFEVMPRLAGSTVQIDIATANGSTTASGPLGEWFELGAVATGANRNERGIASQSRSNTSETRRAWIKVEALP
jgi:hypothetical protein